MMKQEQSPESLKKKYVRPRLTIEGYANKLTKATGVETPYTDTFWNGTEYEDYPGSQAWPKPGS